MFENSAIRKLKELAPTEEELLRLDPRDRFVYISRFMGKTLEEIAGQLSVTRERVRQIQEKAVRQILSFRRRPKFYPDTQCEWENSGVKVRTYNVLKHGGYETVEEIRETPDSEFLAMKHCGPTTLKDIRFWFGSIGEYGFREKEAEQNEVD